MRLTENEVLAIKESFLETFPKGDSVWLFGSRTNMNAFGGDIDLYIKTACNDILKISEAKYNFLNKLTSQIGEQKIDIVLHLINNDFNLPIYEIAQNQGIRLV
jgi:predicted nucleotidyltransferase